MGIYKGLKDQSHLTWNFNTEKYHKGRFSSDFLLSLTCHLPYRNPALQYCQRKEIYANSSNMLNKADGSHEKIPFDTGYFLTILVSMGHNLEKESCLIAFWIEPGHCGDN